MKGKEKCRALKEIRKQIAEKNDIEYVVSECSFQGECKGTCPKCESELRYLERELAIRQNLGKTVAIVGISAGVCASLTACSPVETIDELTNGGLRKLGIIETTTGVLPAPVELAGDAEIAIPEPTNTPMPEEVLMGEMPVDTMPPESMETGEVIPQVTFLPEDIEGGIMLVETPAPEGMEEYIIEGDIALAPQEVE